MITLPSKTRLMSTVSTPLIYIILGLLVPGIANAVACTQCENQFANQGRAYGLRVSVDPLGINIPDSTMMRRDTFLTIGDPENGGLAWGFANSFSSYEGTISTVPHTVNSNEYLIQRVRVGDIETIFRNTNGGAYVGQSGDGAKLVLESTNWKYTTLDGTIYRFDLVKQRLISIARPDGTVITITYRSTGRQDGDYPFDTVVSNRGYALKYILGANSLITIKAVNLTAHSCDALINCDVYDNYVTVVGGYGKIITNSSGSTWRYDMQETYEYQLNGQFFLYQQHALTYYQNPVGYAVTLTYNNAGEVTQLSDFRGNFKFNYRSSENILGGGNPAYDQLHPEAPRYVTLTDPSGNIIYNAGFHVGGSVHYFKSYLNDTVENHIVYETASTDMTIFSASPSVKLSYARLVRKIYPEGNKTEYEYNASGGIILLRNIAKAGSGLPDRVETAAYTNGRPIWTVDAKGNQTDYTYDATHLGLLTVTLPADQAGLRNRIYNSYTAFDTGNGVVYRLTRSETCGLTAAQLSLTACPALVTTSVKTVNYGTSTTAPKTYKTSLPLSVTQTDGGGTLSATTTYAYDNVGNVISVDGPLAGTVDQSFTTYDANRRKIFEIGPIPGGTGTQKRSLVRHQYNGDGQETQTAQGYASTNATNGSDVVFTSYTRFTYDTAGRLTKTDDVVMGNVVP